MHIVRVETRSLDEAAPAVDLDQSPADIVLLSFTDSDLSSLAAAWERAPDSWPSLRLANLALLKHPFSVDLYVEKVCAKARFVFVRLLGGMDYWRYGVDELAAAARARGFHLAIAPGDRFEDSRLEAASTLPHDDLAKLWRYFEAGGPDNMAACLRFIAHKLGAGAPIEEPRAVAPFGIYHRSRHAANGDSPRALIVFYRSIFMAGDVAPIDALADALATRGMRVDCAYVTSLKDAEARAPLAELIASRSFDVILNATAFSARLDTTGSVLDDADAPVLQVILAGAAIEQWTASARGLGPADLAMHVVLPEFDGRILSRAISFKGEEQRSERLEYSRVTHRPHADRIAYVADLALAWASLRRKRVDERRIACVLSDYPAKGGRVGYAVGLDSPASVCAIAADLSEVGYDIGTLPNAADLIAHLSQGGEEALVTLADYNEALAQAPAAFADAIKAQWGDSADDASVRDGAFRFRIVRAGRLTIAVQPDRGRSQSRKSEYHDATLAPRHAYFAFYIWLRRVEKIDAMIHLGTHGTLEWLPGKSVALSNSCAPEIILGSTPVVYPFIVNNPGEAAQAKRRIGAVTIGHLTPPLIEAGSHGAAQELEGLFDEFAEAQDLDPRRARAIANLILDKAADAGLARECAANGLEPAEALRALDAWLCDLKELRIGDGLHIYGREAGSDFDLACFAASTDDMQAIRENLTACADAEKRGLLRALDGRFVEPGPAGAPSRGRLDVLPTGRNLYAMDPRAVPTRNAWEIGRRTADEVIARYAQDHGEWPKRIVLDLWGSATMRTGGDDIAQALALLGVRPKWDHASNRVNGFEILPLSLLGRSRVDVTLRISGLFRDVFPSQIALLHQAIQAIAGLDESHEDNPLAGESAPLRIFGAAPGRYGLGLTRTLAEGAWTQRDELGAAYLAATGYAYAGEAEAAEAPTGFAQRIANADAFVHAQDIAGQDILDSDAYPEHEGGFAAAASKVGRAPALYHVDTARPEKSVVRPLGQEIARVLRGRAVNPRWIAGQMRHGHRGATEIAQTLDNLFAYAAMTDVVESRQFDLLFDATLGDERVRDFLVGANPLAARGMAARFDEAARRGFWLSRRNSSAQILAQMLRSAA
jgi:cobaltochelatase CobN